MFVQGANREAYRDVVMRQFGEWDDEFQDNHFAQKWQRGGFEVIETKGVPIGAIWTTDEEDHLRLRDMFIVPSHQGKGIGSQLVREELARARRHNKPLRLRVLRENRARALYERLGLSVCGETETQYLMEAV